MKTEVWNDPEPKKEEKVLRLRLVQTTSGVTLKAVDATGLMVRSGRLVDISQDGIYIIGGVGNEVGIALDEHNRVKVRTGSEPLN